MGKVNDRVEALLAELRKRIINVTYPEAVKRIWINTKADILRVELYCKKGFDPDMFTFGEVEYEFDLLFNDIEEAYGRPLVTTFYVTKEGDKLV